MKPKILITNDDGVHAPGIRHLYNALKDIADVTVVAPASDQSAISLSITIRSPLRVDEVEWPSAKVWSVNGTPADSVKLALNVIMDSPPDLILSGINRGNNAGRNILYSGTVAAIIEGVMHDIPGIAFSSSDYFEPKFEHTEPFIPDIVNYILDHPLPQGTFLNVNFPENIDQGIMGCKMSRQGREYWKEKPDKRNDPHSDTDYYWLGLERATFDEHEGSDITYLNEGYLTAVPIRISELTNHEEIKSRQDHFNGLFERTRA